MAFFNVRLIVRLILGVLTFELVDEMLNFVLIKAVKQYFPVVLYMVVLSFESVDEIVKGDH